MFTKCILNKNLFKIQKQIFQRCLFSTKNRNEPRITVTDDGKTIVCWHPEESFPYEHSLPYHNDNDYEINCSTTFKIETLEKGENIYHKLPATRLEMEELRALTYTNKDYWRRRRFDGLQMRPEHPRKGV